jgi:probable F420-dependent oxidoreductase
MDLGIVAFATDYGLPPVDLGRAVEERGFDALFLTEHTHIPASRLTPLPAGGELPRRYSHTFDPYVALSAISAVTETIRIGTGVSLVAQHDPIVLAKVIASLDQISNGRVEIGIGAGWNVEEAANHGVTRARTARMLETVEAMRVIWTNDDAEFHGRFIDFDPIWSWPKPTKIPPILIGGNGPTAIERVIAHGDGWMPLKISHNRLDGFASRIRELNDESEAAGRAPLPITIYGATATPEAIVAYSEIGIQRILFELRDHGDDKQAYLRELDALAELIP